MAHPATLRAPALRATGGAQAVAVPTLPRAWEAAGSPADVEAWCAAMPAPPERRIYGEKPCAVGCLRPAEVTGLCKSCVSETRKRGLPAAAYLATQPTPRPGFGTCRVSVCTRMAALRRTRLCGSHQRQWSDANRPDLDAWAAQADPVYTAIDEVPLSGVQPLVRLQVLVGYQAQLRAGGRLSPSQVKSAVVWLRQHQTADLLAADLPAVGATTTYLRLRRQTLRHAADSPTTARRSMAIRLAALSPHLGGTVRLSDVQAPWLVHLAQEQVWALTAAGASAVTIMNVGHAIRWFALFLRSQHPDQGRTARGVGRAGVMAYLEWLAQRVRDTEDFQRLDAADPRRGARRAAQRRGRPRGAAQPQPAAHGGEQPPAPGRRTAQRVRSAGSAGAAILSGPPSE